MNVTVVAKSGLKMICKESATKGEGVGVALVDESDVSLRIKAKTTPGLQEEVRERECCCWIRCELGMEVKPR